MPTERQKARATQKALTRQWQRALIAEREYSRALQNVGRQVGSIINGFLGMLPTLGRQAQEELDEALRRYADLITPWAMRVTQKMHKEIAWRDWRAWMAMSRHLGRSLAIELREAPTGAAFHQLLAEQVHLIRSIPLDAAVRVHERTEQAMLSGQRFDTLIEEIMASGDVSMAQARTIARTETARTNSVLTQVRAEQVGATHYTWLSARDEQVRPLHRALDGKVFAWNDPPVADAATGIRAHPGEIWNCRCVAIPILPSQMPP